MINIHLPVRGTLKSKPLDNVFEVSFRNEMGSQLAAKRSDWQQSVRLAQAYVRVCRAALHESGPVGIQARQASSRLSTEHHEHSTQ